MYIYVCVCVLCVCVCVLQLGKMATWDGDMVYGCYCDDYDWEGVGGAKVYGWEGYDCSLRAYAL